jgi:hypothetical protein
MREESNAASLIGPARTSSISGATNRTLRCLPLR